MEIDLMDINGGHRKRLKDRFKKDNGMHMEEYEILELLLMYSIPRRDVKPLAKKLIKEFESLGAVLGADVERLKNIDGIGESTALLFKLVHRSSSLSSKEALYKGHVISQWEALLEYAFIELAWKDNEEVHAIFLDIHNRLIKDEMLTKGTINEAPFYPREIVKRCLELAASTVIIVHNHPSGIFKPSTADIALTMVLFNICKDIDIVLWDHIIIGKEGHFSFKNEGYFDGRKKKNTTGTAIS